MSIARTSERSNASTAHRLSRRQQLSAQIVQRGDLCERSPSLREQLNRSGAYLSIFVASLCLFATLLFLTYYL